VKPGDAGVERRFQRDGHRSRRCGRARGRADLVFLRGTVASPQWVSRGLSRWAALLAEVLGADPLITSIAQPHILVGLAHRQRVASALLQNRACSAHLFWPALGLLAVIDVELPAGSPILSSQAGHQCREGAGVRHGRSGNDHRPHGHAVGSPDRSPNRGHIRQAGSYPQRMMAAKPVGQESVRQPIEG